VDPKNTPKFAFRAQQFNELPEETIREIFSLGIKQEDIIDQETMK
jgi:hypothetical protein